MHITSFTFVSSQNPFLLYKQQEMDEKTPLKGHISSKPPLAILLNSATEFVIGIEEASNASEEEYLTKKEGLARLKISERLFDRLARDKDDSASGLLNIAKGKIHFNKSEIEEYMASDQYQKLLANKSNTRSPAEAKAARRRAARS
jgi:hypothetical protein